MATIPTGNILQPGSIASQANLNLISGLQLLTPQSKKEYVLKYGDETFTWWLNAYAGMEEVKNREYFWFENRSKLMQGVYNFAAIVAPAAGATVELQLPVAFHFNAGTQTPLRAGITVRVMSSNIEGEILAITDTTPNAFKYTVRPKKVTEAFVSAGSADLLAGEGLEFGGYMDAGEASDSIVASQHLDVKYTNTYTEMRETYSTTDLGSMTEIFYNSGAGSPDIPVQQSGSSYFTYKNMIMAEKAYVNYVDRKLMFGGEVTNTGMYSTNSAGSQGILPKVLEDGEIVTYNPGTLDIAKLHEITRIADVNGCAKQCMWLQDINQRQDFSDGIFAEFPAGAFQWGKNDVTSEEAAVAYGTKSLYIDGYLFSVKKYPQFNPEYVFGITPPNARFRDFGMICPLGDSPSYRAKGEDGVTKIKNITLMYSKPPNGGTNSNGIRVWQHGGASMNPTTGKMESKVEFITYRGTRISAANQFILVQKT